MSGIKFKVDIISHKTIEVEAPDARTAAEIAKNSNPFYKVDAVFWENEQTGVDECLACGKLILTDLEEYEEDGDSSDKFCSTCMKNEEFQQALKENGEEKE